MNAYLRLTRLDRPLRILLLYILPCWWGVTLAQPHELNVKLLLLFTIGATLIRGAGCTFNDLIDRDIDRHVARTKLRPLASGELSSSQAAVFFCLQGLVGLMVLTALPSRCWPLCLVELALLVVYPFMKRVTYWPQLLLGFAINWGIIFGVVAAIPYESINWPAVLSLYGAGIAWTVGYDTIYALQDKEDDLKVGVKSTAIRFGENVKSALIISYSLMFIMLGNIGYWANAGIPYFSFVGFGALATGVLIYHFNPLNIADCQRAFHMNPYLGWVVWGALLNV